MIAAAPGVAEVMRLLTAAEAVAGIAADLAVRLEGAAVPAEIAARARAVAAVAAPGLGEAPAPVQRATLGAIRALLRQAGDLVAAPTRPAGWSYDDPAMLDEQGRASRGFGPILAAQLARLGPPAVGHRHVLDIGTGAGHLALGLAEALPDAHVTGVDVWPPALACARANVADAGLGDRVTIAARDATALDERDRYDLAWVPGPFLPAATLAPILDGTRAALRPGGVVCFGIYAGPDDPLADAVIALRTARSGGLPMTAAEAIAWVAAAGFRDVHEVPRTWSLPLRLIAARR
ncbi:MAG: class I SAM-dependent methyltransferase [Myxococcales bacterium]|nr:class I SAM-dependent methyltransferase [Myxococcales bacterium]